MPKRFSVVVNARADSDQVEILLHGPIGKSWWSDEGITGKEVTDAINAVPKGQKIVLGINSQGGAVGEGLAIYNAIERRRDDITARIDGYALSIASFFPLAAGRVVSPKSSIWMIHRAWNLVEGNADDLRKGAELLDTHDEVITQAYIKKTKKTRAEIHRALAEETWFTGEEAINYGLADEEGAGMGEPEAMDLSCYKNAPKNIKEFLEARRVPVASGSKPMAVQASARVIARAPVTTKPPVPAGQHKANMQKTNIIARLKEHGKEPAQDATDEQLLAALAELVTNGKILQAEADALTQPETKEVVSSAELRELRRTVAHERNKSIRHEFRTIAMDRPYLKEEDWINALMADEGLFAKLREMPKYGTDPVRRIPAEDSGNGAVEEYRKLKPGQARMKYAVNNWNGLRESFRRINNSVLSGMSLDERLRRLENPGPQAANTFSATLVTDRLADAFITTIGTKLAALRGFSREFGTDRMKPRATVQVRKVTVASTTLTNATNFEQGGSTTVPVSVSVSQITQPFDVTNDELNKGHRVEQIAEKNAQAFANALSDVWTALVTVANYGTAIIVGVAATFDATDLAPIFAVAKNYGSKNLILDGGHLAYLLPTDKFKFRLGEEGAYNFDLIAEQNRWTGATANTVGFICDPNAIAVCSGLPIDLPSQEFLELNTVTVESLGLTVQLCHWFSRAGREHWMSFDVMFGAQAGDTTAAEVLVTA